MIVSEVGVFVYLVFEFVNEEYLDINVLIRGVIFIVRRL